MGPAERRRVLATASACVFANFLAFLGLTPLFPNVAHDLGLGPDTLGAYFGVSAVVSAVLQIPVGVLADRVGRRPILSIGMLLMCTAQVIRSQATSGLVFACGQVFIGACSAFVVAVGYATVADAYARAGRAQAFGLMAAATNLGQVVGFLLAGLLGQWIGWRGYSLVVAGLPILLLALTGTLPEPPRQAPDASTPRAMLHAVGFLLQPRPGGIALIAALSLGAGFSAGYLLPFVARTHGYGEASTSLLLIPYVAGSVVGAPLFGRIADASGVRGPLLISCLLAAGALAAFAALPFSLASVAASFVLVGAGAASALSLASTAIAEVAAQQGAGMGAALGGIRIGQQLGPALGPAVAGTAYVHQGKGAAYLLMASYMIVTAAIGAFATAATSRAQPQLEPGR